MQDTRFVEFEIRLTHQRPVDLITMANSLISLNNLSKEHISKEHGIQDTKILLEGVREGSDIYKVIMDISSTALPIANSINTLKDVIEYFRSYLTLEKKSLDEIKQSSHYNEVNAKSIENLIAPIETDNSNSSMSFSIKGDNNNVFVINASDIPKIKENTSLVKKITTAEELEDDTNPFQKVLIKMHKATNTQKVVKDSSYCDSIIPGKAIATLIEDKEAKKDILQDPFNNYFLVDIEISKIDGEIKLYRVTKLHDIIPKEEK